MKIKIIALLSILVFSQAASAALQCSTVVYGSCHSGTKYSKFIVKGQYQTEEQYCGRVYHVGIAVAAYDFLKAEYTSKLRNYCDSGTHGIGSMNASLFSSKSEANKWYSKLASECADSPTYKKCVLIKGWDADDWR